MHAAGKRRRKPKARHGVDIGIESFSDAEHDVQTSSKHSKRGRARQTAVAVDTDSADEAADDQEWQNMQSDDDYEGSSSQGSDEAEEDSDAEDCAVAAAAAPSTVQDLCRWVLVCSSTSDSRTASCARSLAYVSCHSSHHAVLVLHTGPLSQSTLDVLQSKHAVF